VEVLPDADRQDQRTATPDEDADETRLHIGAHALAYVEE
jgi:hypothetical protein